MIDSLLLIKPATHRPTLMANDTGGPCVMDLTIAVTPLSVTPLIELTPSLAPLMVASVHFIVLIIGG